MYRILFFVFVLYFLYFKTSILNIQFKILVSFQNLFGIHESFKWFLCAFLNEHLFRLHLGTEINKSGLLH